MNKHLFKMVVTALGIAMFFVVGKFLAIPTPIPNFSLFLQYAIQIVFSFYFGPVVGFSVGFIGHFLVDLISGWGIWMSWIVSSGVFGLLTGLTSLLINKHENPFKAIKIILFSVAAVISGAICWILIAPIGDLLFYGEPYNLVVLEGLIAFGTNTGSALLIGLPLIFAVKKVHIKHSIIKNSQEN